MKADNILLSGLSGSMAGCTGVIFSYPLDYANARLRLQRARIAKTPHGVELFRNPFDCISKIRKHEGLTKIQKGLSAAYAYQFIMNGIRFGTYEFMNSFIDYHTHIPRNIFVNLAIGMTSGFAGAAIALPFQVIKVRLQNDLPFRGRDGYNYNSLVDAFRKVYCTEGMGGFIRGAHISLLSSAWMLGVQVTTFNILLNSLTRAGESRDSLPVRFCSAFTAGLAVSVFCKPTDCIAMKVSTLIQKGRNNQFDMKYRKVFRELIASTKTEGIKGFYKGYPGFALLQVTHSAIALVAFGFYMNEMKPYIVK